MSVSLLVNGEPLDVQAGLSLTELIAQCGFDTDAPFVVSVNDKHVPVPNLPAKRVNDGDRVEVLTVRQGG